MFNRQSLHIALLVWGVIFSLLAALCMFMSKNFEKEKRRMMMEMEFSCAFLLMNDAFAWGFRGGAGELSYYMVRASNFFVFLMCNVLLYQFHEYMSYYLFGKSADAYKLFKKQENDENGLPAKRIKAVYIVAVIGMFFVVISQFTGLYYYFDESNFYHRSTFHFMSLVVPMIGMVIDLTLLIKYRKNVRIEIFVSLISYIVLPFIATIILIFFYGISLANIAICISMILMFVVAMIEQNEKVKMKEQEAADMRVSMMLSQIAPHFIYNTLASIKYMCVLDPYEARNMIDDFSTYLRGNIDSISQKELIPFAKELDHVKCYLSIEQKRFGDRVKAEYDIKETDFCVPALTLQPLVENAVKHGICKKEEGGTVNIKTYREGSVVNIEIIDDGVGFDATQKNSDERAHVGIVNVKTRLEVMCDGTLRVYSTPGRGSRMVISIPRIL